MAPTQRWLAREGPRRVRDAARKAMLAWRATLDVAEVQARGVAITRSVLDLAPLQDARVVCCYMSTPHEVPTVVLADWVLAQDRRLVVPRVERGAEEMTLHEIYDPRKELTPGVFGIPTPAATCPRVMPAEVDLALVPGLAFDARCNRIGFGAGYYDRFLGAAPDAFAIGLFFDGQMIPDTFPESWDQPLNVIVTETTIYRR